MRSDLDRQLEMQARLLYQAANRKSRKIRFKLTWRAGVYRTVRLNLIIIGIGCVPIGIIQYWQMDISTMPKPFEEFHI